MGTVKKIKKAQSGLCTPSSKRGGGVSCGPKRAYKSEEYKPGKRIKFDNDEPVVTGRGSQEKPYERDFPGDVAPGGFGGAAKGKKSTRWKTNTRGKIEYAGQGKFGKKVVKKAKSGIKQSKKKK
jgi:hypothetical protein